MAKFLQSRRRPSIFTLKLASLTSTHLVYSGSVLNVNVLAGAFNQEKALRGPLRDRENFADGSFAALVCMLGTAAVAEEDDNKQCDP